MIADWIVFRLTGTLVTRGVHRFHLGHVRPRPTRLVSRDHDPVRAGARPVPRGRGGRHGSRPGVRGGVPPDGPAPGTPVAAGGLDTALGLAGPRGAVPGRLTVTG